MAAELPWDAADPLEQQRAHGPSRGRPAGPGYRLSAARRGPVPGAAERPRVARRRAETHHLLVAADSGSRDSANGSGGGRDRAGRGGHMVVVGVLDCSLWWPWPLAGDGAGLLLYDARRRESGRGHVR